MEIQVQLEDVSAVKKKLRVQIPAQVAQQEFDRIAQDYRQHARLPGFRAGKAPVALVKRRFLQEIRGEVVRSLLPRSYEEALQKTEVTPLREPSVEPVDYHEGEPLAYVAEFEIRPAVQLGQYKGVELKAASREVGDKDVEEQLESLRLKHATLEAVEDRPIREGDLAVVDLQGELLDESGDAEPGPPAIQDEDVTVEVGGENTHAPFTEALLGMNVAEEKRFEIDYPADYPREKLAGRKVRFRLEVTDIKARRLPELNDDLAKDAGEFETLDELRAAVRKDLAARLEQRHQAELKNQLLEKLVQAHPFEVPGVLVEEQIDRRLRELAESLVAQGRDPFKANLDWRQLRENMRPSAESAVRTDLVLAEIARAESIQASQEDLEREIQQMADSLNHPVEKVRQMFQQEERMAGLAAELRRRKTIDFLLSQARVG